MKQKDLYNHSLALLTDLYQLTMAYGYYKEGMHEYESVFHLTFRKNPFGGGYAVACGIETVKEYLRNFRFENTDIEYLKTLTGNDDKPLFDSDFLNYLSNLEFGCDIDGVLEGTVVFPHEPILRVRGPLLQCQLLETALLNIINFQTLIATKASRICYAAGDDPVLEFGLRRAQGIDGSLAASRAAFIGGCSSTSNVLAGKLFDIPVKGTHAHSWIMCFENEIDAFDTYAKYMPNNCVLLVDTYNTLAGVKNAVCIGKKLKERGYELGGIRLDSGDLAYLSIEARKVLDDNGLFNTNIVASNDLDEHIIASLKQQGAKIDIWGGGTKLITAHDQPALGGVYKLSAIKDRPCSPWKYTIKLSEQKIKTSNPGILQIRRFANKDCFIADMIYDTISGIDGQTIIDQEDFTRQKVILGDASFEDLLKPISKKGKLSDYNTSAWSYRDKLKHTLSYFHEGIKRHYNPHQYPVGLETKLHQLKTELIFNTRKSNA